MAVAVIVIAEGGQIDMNQHEVAVVCQLRLGADGKNRLGHRHQGIGLMGTGAIGPRRTEVFGASYVAFFCGRRFRGIVFGLDGLAGGLERRDNGCSILGRQTSVDDQIAIVVVVVGEGAPRMAVVGVL
jgi:hypothetical protein